MKNIYKNEILEWSNLFLLIPLALAVIYNIYWYAIILFVVFIVSFDFHFFKESKQVYYLDVTFSSIIMLLNFVLLFKGHWVFPFSILAILSALTALFFYYKKSKSNYYFNHSLWHIFSAFVCIFCLMTFLSYSLLL